MIAESPRSLGLCRGAFTDHRINAPASGAIKHDKQKKPAIEDSQLAFVRNLWSGTRDWEKLGHWRWGVGHMDHKISHCHLTTADESSDPSKQTKGDEKSTDKLNPTADLHHHVV